MVIDMGFVETPVRMRGPQTAYNRNAARPTRPARLRPDAAYALWAAPLNTRGELVPGAPVLGAGEPVPMGAGTVELT